MRKSLLFALPIMLLFTACGEEETPVELAENLIADNTPTPVVPEVPVVDGFTMTPSGLQYKIHSKGDGPKIKRQDCLHVHYVGLLSDGTEFDNSVKRDMPLWVAVGTQMVIPGWDEGLSLLSIGDSATFLIPSNIAYGEQARPGIPANSDLKFHVKVIEREGPFSYFIGDEDFKTDENGIKIAMVQEKPENEGIKTKDEVAVHYTVFDENGVMVDNSYKRGQPYVMKIDVSQEIRGWHLAVPQMRVGEKARVIVPSNLAYGPAGSGHPLAGQTLTFDLYVVAKRSE